MVLKNTDPTAHAEVTAIREVRLKNLFFLHVLVLLEELSFCSCAHALVSVLFPELHALA